MDIFILQNIWFGLAALLLGVFITLGGFDFGACMLAAKSRRAGDFAMGAILPFGDANQVWLITAGGALFAAFPAAYSSALSQLYVPVMLFLTAIISRVAAIEFYFAKPEIKWRTFWRYAAAASSALSFLLLGVALGVIFSGGVFGREGGFSERFLALFNFKTVFCGLALLSFSFMHGALFLCFKSAEGFKLFAKEYRFGFAAALVFCALYFFVFLQIKSVFHLSVFCAAFAALCVSRILFAKKKFGSALVFSGLFALASVAAHAIAAYPAIIPPQITIANSSSAKTLGLMLLVAGVGVPVILCYTAYAYRVFLKKPQKK